MRNEQENGMKDLSRSFRPLYDFAFGYTLTNICEFEFLKDFPGCPSWWTGVEVGYKDRSSDNKTEWSCE